MPNSKHEWLTKAGLVFCRSLLHASLFEITSLLGVEPRALCLLQEYSQPFYVLILRQDLSNVFKAGLELTILLPQL